MAGQEGHKQTPFKAYKRAQVDLGTDYEVWLTGRIGVTSKVVRLVLQGLEPWA